MTARGGAAAGGMAPQADVVIVGAGVAGLMLASKLSGIGVRVVLVEQAERFAAGASTRNEGWLHNGSYHAVSIPDGDSALQVARRCRYGHAEIRRFAPEAVENPDLACFAVAGSDTIAEKAVARWDLAGVPFQAMSRDDLKMRVPEVDLDRIAACFLVHDVSIDTRLLYRKLAVSAERNGALLIPKARAQLVDVPRTRIRISTESYQFEMTPAAIIYTAGYGTSEIFTTQYRTQLDVRFWKSHLILMERFVNCGLFFLDPHEAAMMPHEDGMIIGLNEDATECDKPEWTPLSDSVRRVHDAVRRLVPSAPADHFGVACIKVDISTAGRGSGARSLNVFWDEPLPNHLWLLPGKMTEAPYVTDLMCRKIASRLDDKRIALRPIDEWLHNKSL